MKKVLSKLCASALCMVLAASSTIGAGAAQVSSEPASSDSPSFTTMSSTLRIFDNQIYVSRSNIPSSSFHYVEFCDENNQRYSADFKDLMTTTGSKTITLPKEQNYAFYFGFYKPQFGGTASSNSIYKSYNNTGGYYKKVRIKLSDFDKSFAPDGSMTVTQDVFGTHKFSFGSGEIASDGKEYYSALCVYSGGTVTAVTPNSNGEIDFFMSTAVGESVYLNADYTVFYENNNAYDKMATISGGFLDRCLYPLTIGNANSDNSVDIKDATEIQVAIAGKITLNDLQTFVSDVNFDNKIDIKDVTALQRYLAETGI